METTVETKGHTGNSDERSHIMFVNVSESIDKNTRSRVRSGSMNAIEWLRVFEALINNNGEYTEEPKKK